MYGILRLSMFPLFSFCHICNICIYVSDLDVVWGKADKEKEKKKKKEIKARLLSYCIRE